MAYVFYTALALIGLLTIWYFSRNSTWMGRLTHWLFDIREVEHTPQSRYTHLAEKLPLLMVMFGSSALVGISTYNTFPPVPVGMEWLTAVASIIGGLSFDIILTVVAFSLRKNAFSILTMIAALVIGFMIALDLYMGFGLKWLHATYIIMGILYVLHTATTRGLDIETLEQNALDRLQTVTEQQQTIDRLEQTNADLQQTNTNQVQTISDLEQTNTSLQQTNENFAHIVLQRWLETEPELSASKASKILGKGKQWTLDTIAELKKETE